MKKKIIGGIAVMAFAITIGLNVKMNSQEDTLMALSMQNVEALALEVNPWDRCRTDDGNYTCWPWNRRSGCTPCGIWD